MPKPHSPRSGSMQYWPRKRAKRHIARVRTHPKSNEAKLVGFAGYKAGMTHCQLIDNRPYSKIKDKEIFCPITIIECPPIKTFSARFYKTKNKPKKCVLVS